MCASRLSVGGRRDADALCLQGLAAHGAYPWLGVNPIDKLMDVLRAVLDARVNDAADGAQAPLFNGAAGLWHTTAQVTSVTAGSRTVPNQVPGTAHAILDMRFTEQWSAETLLARVREVIPAGEAGRWSVDVTPLLMQPAFVLPGALGGRMRARVIRARCFS